MSYIIASELRLQFGGQVILDGASFAVHEQDRIGLVGPNGSGKSTLLKILHGQSRPDSGDLTFARRLRVGYLPQDVLELSGGTLLASVLASVPGRAELEARLADVETALEQEDEEEEQIALAQALADVHEELAHFEEQFSQHEAVRILRGLGFTAADDERPVQDLSGGWKMRAALAGLLFQRPDVLLLDEPTNHLDVPTIQWVDEFLRGFRHALVLISHDRTFLNRQINRVLSFEMEGLRNYPGNYDQYVRLREEELRVIEAQAAKQDRVRKNMERYIARFRVSARRSSQAQSRIKALDRMETFALPRRRKSLSFTFPSVERCGEVAIKATGLGKAFGDLVLYRDLAFHVFRGDRIAVIGVNGIGKTTLLRMLASELTPDAGEVEMGHHVNLGYYAQHHTEMLSPRNTALQEVLNAAPQVTEEFARSALGVMMFSGDEALKPVSVLSGGEKARVALAGLLASPRNVLLMDEPTNHLDLDSSEALAEALQRYPGTLVFVSHNQAFVDALATKVWDVSGGTLTEYQGNLAEYLDHIDRRRRDAADVDRAGAPPSPAEQDRGGTARAGKTGRGATQPPPADARAMRRLGAEIDTLEARIEKLEAQQAEYERKLGTQEVYENQVLFQSVLKDFEAVRDDLERLMPRWERKQAELEALQRGAAAS